MTYLLARLDAALARAINCVADKVFGAIDAALFHWPDEDAVLYPRWKMTGPGSLTTDGAEWLSDWEAENEVHEPKTYTLEDFFKMRDALWNERPHPFELLDRIKAEREAEHEVHEPPPLEDDRVAMMLGLVPDKRTPNERLWDAIRTNGKSLKYHYEVHEPASEKSPTDKGTQ